MPAIISIIGDTTPKNMIEVKYERAKNICSCIWDKPERSVFEDIFHDTIYRCLVVLGERTLSQDFMKAYFFKAFRINMVRYFGYAYNKYSSGVEIEDVVIPVEYNFNDHIDGFQMLDHVKSKWGIETHDMLWDNLNGMTYKELDKKYDTNTFYHLSKIKEYLKKYYIKEINEYKRKHPLYN